MRGLSAPGLNLNYSIGASGWVIASTSGTQSFQSGYATWAPHHTALAYGNAGVAVVDPATGKSRWLVRGQSLTDRQLIDRLNDLGYAQRASIEKPGEFAIGRATTGQ